MRIDTGDTVTVYLDQNGDCTFSGTVIAIPCATGDCWVIDSQDSVHYVQTFAQIVKRKQP